MGLPQPMPSAVLQRKDESYGGVTYHIEGALVPVLEIDLTSMPVYFEHHVLLWKNPSVQISVKAVKGGFTRLISGMPVFLTEAKGPGRIAFSRDGVGQVFGIHLERGQSVDVREHQFLAATETVSYSSARMKGSSNILMGSTGFFIDTFSVVDRPGLLWLHGYGNVFESVLEQGEQIDIEPGGWVYKDQSVQMQTIHQSLGSGLLAGTEQMAWTRFTGPGRVCLQSKYIHLPTAG
ncbi:MAG: AIM24 family protein [Dehalococcoidia bacterium]|nr:AIM24 family protein [Dehalococcoidia bacterium]